MGGQTLTRSYSYDKRAQSLNLYTCFAILDYEIQSEKKKKKKEMNSRNQKCGKLLLCFSEGLGGRLHFGLECRK